MFPLPWESPLHVALSPAGQVPGASSGCLGSAAVPRCLGIAAGRRCSWVMLPSEPPFVHPEHPHVPVDIQLLFLLQQQPFPRLMTSTEPHPPGARSRDQAAARSRAPALCTHTLPPWIPPLHGFLCGKAPVPPISKLTSPDDHNYGCFSPRRESWSQEEIRELWGRHY